MVKNSPYGAGSVSPISGWGAKIPHASQPKNQSINDRRSILTNSIKDFKIKKKSDVNFTGTTVSPLSSLSCPMFLRLGSTFMPSDLGRKQEDKTPTRLFQELLE